MKKLSVIIPIYNSEKYIQRCIQSVINQTYKNLEIILINDGSTDNTQKILENFYKQDKRIIIINKENEGVSAARNIGIEISSGEYIHCLDSDDWIENDMYEDMIKKIELYDLDIIVSNFYWDYDNGRYEIKNCLPIDENIIINNKDFLKKYFFSGKSYPAIWNKIFKAELYKKNNIRYPSEISIGEDMVTISKLFYCAEKIGKINKTYLHYIQNSGSITKNNNITKIKEIFRATEMIESYFNGLIDSEMITAFNYSVITNVLLSEYDNKNNEYKKYVKKYFNYMKNIENNCIMSKKNRIIFKILKLFPNYFIFEILKKINKKLEERK